MKTHHPDITHALNSATNNSIRWCTPSIDFQTERVLDHYLSDMSVSYESLGFPSEPSGIFLDAYKRAARVYKSDRTLFSVNGSTGSNFIVIRSLSKQIQNLRILAQRNIHKSILNACQDYGVNLLFADANVDPDLQCFLPNSIEEIITAIKKTRPHVLLITNPTYEGIVLDLKKLIEQARKINPKIIIFAEEAWGSHLAFSKKLPTSAMESGADVCVQSTHKQGGSLQQTGMLHWKEERINSDLIIESYRNLSSSSPSYILLASLDEACKQMKKNGAKKILKSLKIARKLSDRLNKIPGFEVITLKNLQSKSSGAYGKDETKVLLDISRSKYLGSEIAKELESRYNIIVEKYNNSSLLFLVPLQSTLKDVDITIDALIEIIDKGKKKRKKIEPALKIPKHIPKILEFGEVVKLLPSQKECVRLSAAIGRIAAENITPYPPGIPTTIQGEQFTEEVIHFYENIKKHPNMHILARDITLNTVVVVK